jgi:L-threonylcarbamoyladenylate synthase
MTGSPAEVVGPGELGRVLAALNAGQVVGLPTDTVYGLGARLDRPEALARVFEVKGRPDALALPVLVATAGQAARVAQEWPEQARQLSARYWPGPLTLVVPLRPALWDTLGGDGRTVGLRRPAHRLLRRVCRATGPLAVTSANRHGEPPATTADAVAALGGPLALVLDGGRCEGTPSTVADCTVDPPRLLREGGVPWAWVEAALRSPNRPGRRPAG